MVAGLAALTASVAGCESDGVVQPPPPPPVDFDVGTMTVNASSSADFAYMSLANGGSVVTPSDPSASTEWHLAFRRFGVRLNGGVAGPGTVVGHNLGTHADLASEAILALTEADGLAAFEAVSEEDIPPAASFVADGLVEVAGSTWFQFDRQANEVVANPRVAWKVRESSGRGYAVFRVVALEVEGRGLAAATLEHRRQGADGMLGAIEMSRVDLGEGPAYLGFGAGLAGGPEGCAWDVSVAASFEIDLNADCGAGTFPLDSTEDFTMIEQAGDAPHYGGFLSTISGAFPADVTDATGTFWYNLDGMSRLWPTYNVFLVQTGAEVYKVQIIDYYSAGGESGHPTVRYQRLR